MRGGLERSARRWWAGELGLLGRVLGSLAAPLSLAWARAARNRAARFERRGSTVVEGLTVVSVGNLAVGGTGKTPVAAWVAARLAAAGARTGVLTGGHGEDESRLHARWRGGLDVASARDRLAGARSARRRGTTALVLDDGFQHFHLARDLDVVLLSADDPFPGHVLPRGPYREEPAALARADVVVVTRRAAAEEDARALATAARRYVGSGPVAGVRLAPSRLRPFAAWARSAGSAGTREDADGAAGLGGGPVLVVCAVARPETVGAAVAEVVGAPAELLALPDHHRYRASDVRRARARAAGRPIVITEKDAVKLTPWASDLEATYVLEEKLTWDWGEDAVAGEIEALLTEPVGR